MLKTNTARRLFSQQVKSLKGNTYSIRDKLIIDGKLVDAKSGQTFDDIDPTNGSLITKVASAGQQDVDAAVQSCTDALKDWKKVPPFVRSRLMLKLADKMEEHMDELETLDSLDVGKLPEEAHGDAMFSTLILRYFAGMANQIHG